MTYTNSINWQSTTDEVVVGTANNTISSISNATEGFVLTNNSSGPPSFQYNPGTFSPNAIWNVFDDFISTIAVASLVTLLFSQLQWHRTNGSIFTYPTGVTSSNPGIVSCNSSIVSPSNAYISGNHSPSGNPTSIILGGGEISLNWVIKIDTLSDNTNNYTFQCGLSDSQTGVITNGVYFQYSDNINSGNWVGVTTAASSSSTANSAVAVSTAAFVNLGITINAAATSVAFFVNGTQIANSPLTTNIPTASLYAFCGYTGNSGTIPANVLLIDLFYMTQTLTTPR